MLANQLLREAADECVWGDQVVPHQSLTPDQMRTARLRALR